MKKALLFFAVLLFVCGCGKDDTDLIPTPIPFPDMLDEISKEYHIKDTVGFDRNIIRGFSISDQEKGLVAIKKGKVWIGVFDITTKEEKQNWTTDNPIGEPINSLAVYRCLSFNWGYTIAISLNIETLSIGSFPVGVMTLNKKDKNAIKILEFKPTEYALEEYSDYFIVIDKGQDYWSVEGKKRTLFNSDGILIVDSLVQINNTSFSYGFNKEKLWIGYNDTDNKTFNEKEVKIKSLDKNAFSHIVMEDSSILFSNFQDRKIWFGEYNYKIDKFQEWVSIDDFERNIKIHKGYGEYEDYYINNLLLNSDYNSPKLIKTPWGYVIAPVYHRYYKDIFILNNRKVNNISIENNQPFNLYNWYSNSFLVRKFDNKYSSYLVVSQNGEVILEKEKTRSFYADPITTGKIESVGYNSYISFYAWSWGSGSSDIRLSRYNLDSDAETPVWENIIKSVPSNAILNTTTIRNNNIWNYQIDIIYFDGTKETVKFSVNIDSGKVTY